QYGKPVLDAKGQPKTTKAKLTEQVIALGPAAAQIAIKQLGTNGGGFFNVNSAHPFENPTPLANFLELLAILVISAALCYTFGVMVGDTRQGWAVLRALRDARLRHHRRVRGRADGRAHARVPRQEDRGLRDEDGLADDPDPAGDRPDRHRYRRGHAGRQGGNGEPRHSWLQRGA